MANPPNILVDNNVVELAFKPRQDDTRFICYYLDENGESPAKNWQVKLCGCSSIEELGEELASNSKKRKNEKFIVAKFAYYLQEYIAKGETPKIPGQYRDLKTIGCWELKCGKGRLVGFYDENLFVVVHGFPKKSKRTPKKDLKTAENRKKNYFKRKKALGLS